MTNTAIEQGASALVKPLDLWNAVQATDPNHTKQFTRGGGFSGTAINHTYQIRKATEMWGPMGGNWRVEIVEQGLMQGSPLVQEDFTEEFDRLYDNEDKPFDFLKRKTVANKVIGHEQIHYVRIKLHYPAGNTTGVVEHFGQTTFVGQNKRGFFTDEEAPKKSLTDAIGKALSMLGFSADVFLGMFDDSKYVNDARKRAEEKTEKEIKAKTAPEPTTTATALVKAKEDLAQCKTVDALREAFAALPKELQAATKEYCQALAKGLE